MPFMGLKGYICVCVFTSQVDCIQEVQREDSPQLARFQSIGVQVEDGWQ